MRFPRVDHTAIVVRDLDDAVERYGSLFGAVAGDRTVVSEQSIEVVFLQLSDTKIELIEPIGSASGVARFLQAHGERLHHIGVAVEDIGAELQRLSEEGFELIDREPRRGVHGRIAFIHPRSTGGVLVELVERAMDGAETGDR